MKIPNIPKTPNIFQNSEESSYFFKEPRLLKIAKNLKIPKNLGTNGFSNKNQYKSSNGRTIVGKNRSVCY
jgi:hypothetical protein